MTVEEWAEVQEIRARIGKNMGIIADYIRGDAGVKIRRLSRAVQLYQQRRALKKIRGELSELMFTDVVKLPWYKTDDPLLFSKN